MLPGIMQKNAEPGRFGFGTTEAVDALLKKLRGQRDMTAMVAINVATLIRNAVGNKSTKAQDAVDAVRSAMNYIATEIGDVCQEKWRDRQHHVLYYYIDSERAVPIQYQRPKNSETANLIMTATKLFLQQVKPSDQTVGNCSAHLRIAEKVHSPSYKGIREAIDSLVQPDVEVQLISHFPMDYHVTLGTARTGWLFRSHTGEMLKMTPMTLAQTVFKISTVPFYPITHVLLGDKYFIKGCADHATKKKLLDLASVDHWSMHTNTYVSTHIKENAITLPYSLD